MDSLPLHPAIVHLPLGLALLMPFLAATVWWAMHTDRLPAKAWIGIVVLQALLLGSAMAAMRTGEGEEDRVETVLQGRLIHQHEALAEQFVRGVGVTLGLAVLVLTVRRPAAARVLPPLVVAATIVVLGLGLRVGRAGGELVYVHGAASAYTSAAAPASDAQGPPPNVRPEEKHAR